MLAIEKNCKNKLPNKMKSVFKKYMCSTDVAQKSTQVPCRCIFRRLRRHRGFDLFLNIEILNDLNNEIYLKNLTKTASIRRQVTDCITKSFIQLICLNS